MARQSRTMKRVRIYLDSADPDQALILQHFEAMEELSTFDRNQWFVNALRDYQTKLTTPGYKANSLSELRHQMMAHFLQGRTFSVEDLAMQPQSAPAPAAATSRTPSNENDSLSIASGNHVPDASEAPSVATPDRTLASTETDVVQEGENDDIASENNSPPESPLLSRLATLM